MQVLAMIKLFALMMLAATAASIAAAQTSESPEKTERALAALTDVSAKLNSEETRLVLETISDQKVQALRAAAILKVDIQSARLDTANTPELREKILARREASLEDANKRIAISDTIAATVKNQPIPVKLMPFAPAVIESIFSITNPALPICGGRLLYSGDSTQVMWMSMLDDFLRQYGSSLSAVGRIEVDYRAYRPGPDGPAPYLRRIPIGTGFVTGGDSVVTAGHVADYFWDFDAKQLKVGIEAVYFNPGAEHSYKCLTATSEPLRKLGVVKNSSYNPRKNTDEGQFDFAVIGLSANEKPFTHTLKFSGQRAPINSRVVVVAYPSEDPRVDEQAWARVMTVPVDGGMYPVSDIKRIAPGRVQPSCANAREIHLPHTASTMNKSSGAPIILIETGEVVGIQVAGYRDMADGAIYCNLALRSDTPQVLLMAQ